jgi:hypothetical protein
MPLHVPKGLVLVDKGRGGSFRSRISRKVNGHYV